MKSRNFRTYNSFVFRWDVEEDGYEWRKVPLDSELRLVGRGGLASRVRRYSPMVAFPSLFREFVKLKTTADAVLRFANVYGNLFDKHDLPDLTAPRGRFVGGSTLKRWSDEIGDMKTIVDFWDAIRERRIGELKKNISWEANAVSYTITTPSGTWSAMLAHETDSDFKEKFARFKSKTFVLPARYALQEEINRRLEFSAVPRLLRSPSEVREDGTVDPDKYFRLAFVPANLVAAMWLQFAQEVTGELRQQRCAGCGRYFAVGPGTGKRAGSESCNPSCRQRRKRRKR